MISTSNTFFFFYVKIVSITVSIFQYSVNISL